MIRRKPTIVSVIDEKQMAFLAASQNSRMESMASVSVDEMPPDAQLADTLPKWVRQATNALLVVPDYWIGSQFFELQARKTAIITAFIERKLRQDHPNLDPVVNFYDFARVRDADRRQMLYCTYLQEPAAYDLYRRLESLGISPHRISTPALIWQATLSRQIDGFGEHGIGFVHLAAGDCFLYFYHLGQFLFSRHIQLPPASGNDPSEIYNLLNYEINQSFYLYSQKSKRSVDRLYMLAADPAAAARLSESLGREVAHIPPAPPGADRIGDGEAFAVCSGFSVQDLKNHQQPSISYKPLQKEMMWRPIQRFGMAVGIFLAVLLALEAGYLHVLGKTVRRQQVAMLADASTREPESVLEELTQILGEINVDLERPSGSGVMMRTLLAMPGAVSLEQITLDALDTPRLTIAARVDAAHPEAFKTILDTFLDRLNQRFNLAHRPLRDKDVRIGLERRNNDEHQPFYRISISFELT